MDDTANSQNARSPEFEDLLSLCKALNDEGARYILIGGFAVVLHGAIRTTKDIDLLVDPSENNIGKIKRALSYLPDNAISQMSENEVEKYQVVRIADEIVIDLLAKACGISYSDAEKEIEWVEIEGITIPIAGKKLLIKMKDTWRPSDKADVNFLRALIEEERMEKKENLKDRGQKA